MHSFGRFRAARSQCRILPPATSIENNYARIGVPTCPCPISPLFATPCHFSQNAQTDNLPSFQYGVLLKMRGAFDGSWTYSALALLLALVFTAPAAAEKRVALVIGNSAYQNVTRLDNPRNDAALMAETLGGLGFTLIG